MFNKTKRILLSVLLALVFASTCLTFTAYAEDMPSVADGDSQVSEDIDEPSVVEPETEDVPPETDAPPATEYVPDETEYVPPETEYVAPVEDETEENNDEPATQSAQDEYIALIDDAQEPTNFIAPKMDKSVSAKTYSTDYTAGIISWICVGVGLIVVIVVLISTKVSGARASQRRA